MYENCESRRKRTRSMMSAKFTQKPMKSGRQKMITTYGLFIGQGVRSRNCPQSLIGTQAQLNPDYENSLCKRWMRIVN